MRLKTICKCKLSTSKYVEENYSWVLYIFCTKSWIQTSRIIERSDQNTEPVKYLILVVKDEFFGSGGFASGVVKPCICNLNNLQAAMEQDTYIAVDYNPVLQWKIVMHKRNGPVHAVHE